MRKFDAALFDIDGTLLDTSELIFQAFEYTLEKHKFPPKTRKEVGVLIGRHIREIYKELAPQGKFEDLVSTHTTFQAKNIHLFSHFTHTKRVLSKLKKVGVKTAAITNRFKTPIKSLELADLLHLVDLVVSGDDVEKVKPHPEAILKALAHFGTSKEKAVMIGDSPTDIEAGKNAKVATIGVIYGFHGERVAHSKPDFLVHDIADILPIILPN